MNAEKECELKVQLNEVQVKSKYVIKVSRSKFMQEAEVSLQQVDLNLNREQIYI